MYRIRFHGRGGQGMKTASRILGTAFFLEGYEVQDAPRYGAERRGAPIFAYVRAAKQTIHERGVIQQPDLVIIADESLASVSSAGTLIGIDKHCVLLIVSNESPESWKHRLNLDCAVLTLAYEQLDIHQISYAGIACTGAAARLTGIISKETLQRSIKQELAAFDESVVANNLHQALDAYKKMAEHEACVQKSQEISADNYQAPEWITLPFDDANISAPAIHASANSVQIKTGLWRSFRPVIDYQHCKHCWWICSTYCPDGAINVDDSGQPQIDYDHCKGCMVCVAQCPSHAISIIPEQQAEVAAPEVTAIPGDKR